MDAELRFHLEAYTDDLVRAGVPRQEALRRARVEFGGVESHKEECRESLGLRLWDEFRADIRYGFRVLRQSPGFTAVAVLSLGLGIGVNTAIFTLTEEVLLKTLSVPHPEQLRLLSWVSGRKLAMDGINGHFSQTPSGESTSPAFSYPVFVQLRHRNRAFQDLFAFQNMSQITATVDGYAEPVAAEMVSGNFYRDLGIRTVAGRGISPADDTPSAASVAVISDSYWSRRFGRSAAVIGKEIELNRIPVTIIGVNLPAFTGAETGRSPEVFLPISLQQQVLPDADGSRLVNADLWWLQVMGRLKPGVTDKAAQAELSVLLEQAVKSTLPNKKNVDMPRIRLLPGDRGLDSLKGEFAKPVYVLMSLAGVVLLIACTNLANLLLARSAARQREMSVRLAIGAGRWRILRQVFTESMLLAVLGGALGLLLGYLARNAIPALMASSWSSKPVDTPFDLNIFGFALGISLFTGLLFGVAPAWRATQADVNAGLADTGRMTTSRSKALAGKALTAVQVALSVLLVIGAGLFIRTLLNLKSAQLGFRPEHILLFDIDAPRSRYPSAKRVALYRELEEKLSGIAGIESLALSNGPLVSGGVGIASFHVTGRPERREDRAWINWVGSRFFETMGIPILYGRAFSSRDTQNSPKVAVINQLLAHQFFPKSNPIGKTFRQDKDTFQIIGVCGNTKYNDLRTDPPPTFYLDYAQQKDAPSMTFEVKTAASTGSVVRAIRETVRSIDKDLPLIDVRTQEEQIEATLSRERMFAALTSGFGILALILASIGIYGVMAYSVARRTSEIGIRMALGAQARQVLSMILREGLTMASVGVIAGVAVGLALTRLISAMLYGLKPTDPGTISAAALLLLGLAVLAGWVPARKASRVDPMVALRHE